MLASESNGAEEGAMWSIYRVRMVGLGMLCGSVPKDPEIVRKWLESRQPKVRPPGGRSIDEINEEVLATIAAGEDGTPVSGAMLGFQVWKDTLVMRASTIKAHIKDSARQISAYYVGKIAGESAFSTKVLNTVYQDERQYWLPILRPDGTPIVVADGSIEKPIHVYSRAGRMNAIKQFDFVDPWRVDVTLKVLSAMGGDGKKNPAVSKTDLERCFMYGSVHGYGGERGDGAGRYTFTIEEIHHG